MSSELAATEPLAELMTAALLRPLAMHLTHRAVVPAPAAHECNDMSGVLHSLITVFLPGAR